MTDIPTLIEQAWAEGLQTTVSGTSCASYMKKHNGALPAGHWKAMRLLLDQAKLQAQPPLPIPIISAPHNPPRVGDRLVVA